MDMDKIIIELNNIKLTIEVQAAHPNSHVEPSQKGQKEEVPAGQANSQVELYQTEQKDKNGKENQYPCPGCGQNFKRLSTHLSNNTKCPKAREHQQAKLGRQDVQVKSNKCGGKNISG